MYPLSTPARRCSWKSRAYVWERRIDSRFECNEFLNAPMSYARTTNAALMQVSLSGVRLRRYDQRDRIGA